jgi:hypothetical protein
MDGALDALMSRGLPLSVIILKNEERSLVIDIDYQSFHILARAVGII